MCAPVFFVPNRIRYQIKYVSSSSMGKVHSMWRRSLLHPRFSLTNRRRDGDREREREEEAKWKRKRVRPITDRPSGFPPFLKSFLLASVQHRPLEVRKRSGWSEQIPPSSNNFPGNHMTRLKESLSRCKKKLSVNQDFGKLAQLLNRKSFKLIFKFGLEKLSFIFSNKISILLLRHHHTSSQS